MERKSSRAATQEYPNPFIHELKLTKAQWIKVLITCIDFMLGSRAGCQADLLPCFKQLIFCLTRDPC